MARVPVSRGDLVVWRLLAAAAITHLVARPPGPGLPLDERLAAWVLVVAATALAIDPRRRSFRVGFALAVVVSFVSETPTTSNHWTLAALVALAVLVDGSAWGGRFRATPGVVLVVVYGFSAFAKLNTAFFDPAVSCAVVLTDSALGLVGLGVDPSSPIAVALPWLAAGMEGLIFVLLLVPRTRRVGAVVGMAFHLLLVLDLPNRFYDFTGVLIPLFLLVAGTADAVDLEVRRLVRGRRWVVVGGAVGAGVVALLAVESPGPVFVVGRALLVVGWFVVMLTVLAVSAKTVSAGRPAPARALPAIAVIVLVLAGLNGLTPYLEVKTTFGFNMFSNLRTEAGETNHLIVPATRASPRFDDLVEVVETDDTLLGPYIGSGFLLPMESLRGYTAPRPDVGLVYRIDGAVVDADPRPPDSPLSEPVGFLRHRFAYLRAVDTEVPKRCEDGYLPLT